MKNKQIKNNKVLFGAFLFVLSVFAFNCSDFTNELSDELPDAQISKFDNQKIILIDEREIFDNNFLKQYTFDFISQVGPEILISLNEITEEARQKSLPSDKVVLLSELRAKNKATQNISTHFRIESEDGKSEDFVLGIRRYIADFNSTEKNKSGKEKLNSNNTYVALNPDKFYLEDDDFGNEIWPVQFEAVNIENSNDKIRVVFDKSGIVSTEYLGPQKSKTFIEDPNILFIEPVSIIEPCEETGSLGGLQEDCNSLDNPGSGSGGTPTNYEDYTRGGPTGTYGAGNVQFAIKSIRLVENGGSDGAGEIQMFIQQRDDYNYKMPLSYAYRFDAFLRFNPITGWNVNTIIEGSDRGGGLDPLYEVPDINAVGVDYNFNPRVYVKSNGLDYSSQVFPLYRDYFPLINLSQNPGPWRLLLVDDDKDYPDFSRRRASTYAQNVQTYDMSSGVWNDTYTKFTTRNHQYQSSDDPISQSGVRRISEANAQSRSNFNGLIVAEKFHSNLGTFKYVFDLEI